MYNNNIEKKRGNQNTRRENILNMPLAICKNIPAQRNTCYNNNKYAHTCSLNARREVIGRYSQNSHVIV